MKDSILSYSSVKQFAKSPNHFIDYKTREQPDKAHFAFGRAVHGYILEPEKFDEDFLVVPKIDRRTKAGKQQYLELMESANDRQLIDGPDFNIVKVIADAVWGTPAAADLLMNTDREQHIMRDIQGVPFHGYADAVSGPGGYCIDLKTCRDASPDAFMRDAHNMDYHLQAAIYSALFGTDRFYWIAVEKDAPYNVAVYMQSPEAASKSNIYLSNLIKKWKLWDGKPKSYSDEIMTLNLPRWA